MLFLDEPTIGLDVTMQKRIRTFVADYNAAHGATVLLTSHYMADVQALCKRVIVIHHGRILFDGALSALTSRFNATKTIGVELADGTADLSRVRRSCWHRRRAESACASPAPTSPRSRPACWRPGRADLTIEDPPIEDVIEPVFATGAGAAAS